MKRIFLLALMGTIVFMFVGNALAEGIELNMGKNGINVKINDATGNGSVKSETSSDQTITEQTPQYSLKYTKHPQGKTIFKVVAPEGIKAKVNRGSRTITNEEIPFSFRASGDTFYKITVMCPSGKWSKKFEAKDGMQAELAVHCASGSNTKININLNVTQQQETTQKPKQEEPAGPSAMKSTDFDRLVAAIKAEDFSDSKLKILSDVVEHSYFKCSQVGRIMDLFDFDADKVKAAAMMYPKVVDKGNFFTVYQHLEFDGSKDELRKKIKGL